MHAGVQGGTFLGWEKVRGSTKEGGQQNRIPWEVCAGRAEAPTFCHLGLVGNSGAIWAPCLSPILHPSPPLHLSVTGPSTWMSHGQNDRDPRLTLAKRNQLLLSCYWSICQEHYLSVLLSHSSLRPFFLRHLLGRRVFLVVQPLLHRLLLSSHTSRVSGRILAVS